MRSRSLLSLQNPSIAIVPGEVHEWKAVLPSLRKTTEVFRLGIKAEDKGNPTNHASGIFGLGGYNHLVKGLPEMIDYPQGEKSLIIDNLSVEKPGIVRIQLLDESGQCVTEAGPLVIHERKFSGYWGDLHGQSWRIHWNYYISESISNLPETCLFLM